MPRKAVIEIDTQGVPQRGCTEEIGRKKRRSFAIAKKMRGLVKSTVLSVPKVEIITVTDTNATPARPRTACARSAGTSFEARISSIGRTARYARFARR